MVREGVHLGRTAALRPTPNLYTIMRYVLCYVLAGEDIPATRRWGGSDEDDLVVSVFGVASVYMCTYNVEAEEITQTM